MILIIKHLLVAIVIVAGMKQVIAQTSQDSTQLSRKEKKALVMKQQFRQNKEMLENRSFVLESDFLQNRYGTRVPVNSTINFLMVDSDEAVIQIGSDTGMGYNGVGGVTAKGKITMWELRENEKKQTFDLTMRVLTGIGIYDVNMTIGSYGALARLTGLRPGNLTFSGDLVALEESAVYEGQSL
jgi:hypothetical protein